MALNKTFIKFGLLTIVFWVSFTTWFVIYPLPLETWVYEPTFWLNAASTFIGIISGALLIAHPPSGRVLAMIVCGVMIAVRLGWLFFPLSELGKKLYAIIFVVFPERPIFVLHNEVVTWAFYVGTMVLLWRKPTA
jgi:hypothetical protein